jgi:hypothetical protein
MTLRIRPVRLNKSIYVRVPNDIADLIGIDGEADVTLRLKDNKEEFHLIYAIRKTGPKSDARLSASYVEELSTVSNAR